MIVLRITLKGGKGSGWHAPPRGTHSGDKHRAVGSGKSVKPKETVGGGTAAPAELPPVETPIPDAPRDVAVSDTLTSKAKIAPGPVKNDGVPSSSINGVLDDLEYANYAASDDKEAFVRDGYNELARSLGIDATVRIVGDAEFNERFAGSNMSEFGRVTAGVHAAIAGAIPGSGEVWLRRRNVTSALGNDAEYTLFQNTVFHELGHVYHGRVWNVIRSSSGPYAGSWVEDFAEGFAGALAFTTDARQAIKFGIPNKKLLARYKIRSDAVKAITDFASQNNPSDAIPRG